MPPPVKVGIVGYGASAKVFNLPFILPNPDLEVVAILQRAEAPKSGENVKPGTHCTVDHPTVRHYRTGKDFFADSNIQLTVICTSSETHFELGEQALNAGKHVVIEKPFTLTSAEADKLIALAKQKKRILTVYQNRRYDSDFRTLRHLMSLDPSPFGKITEFTTHYDIDRPEWISKWTSPELVPGEGMLYGLGTHSIDQALLLFGRPKGVTAFLRVLRMEGGEKAAEDSFTIILQYQGAQKDLIVTIKTTIVSPQIKQMKYVLRGTKGSFQKKGEDVQIENLLEFGRQPTDPGFGVEPPRFHGKLHTGKASDPAFRDPKEPAIVFSGKVPSQPGSYMDYYRDVVSAIRGEKSVAVQPEQSRAGIRVIELARESAVKGLTVPWSES